MMLIVTIIFVLSGSGGAVAGRSDLYRISSLAYNPFGVGRCCQLCLFEIIAVWLTARIIVSNYYLSMNVM